MTSEELIEVLETAGHEPRSYSGRGMFGRRCVGVEIKGSQYDFVCDLMLEALGHYQAECKTVDGFAEKMRIVLRSIGGTNIDSMGLGQIIYWSNFDWPEDEEDEYEDEDEDE